MLEISGIPTCLAKIADGGPTGRDGFGQYRPDLGHQPFPLGRAQPVGRSLRADPGPETGLLGVNVADPGNHRLVQQHRLDGLATGGQHLPQMLRREIVAQGFGPEVRQVRAHRTRGHEIQNTETPGVPVHQSPPVRQVEGRMVVGALRLGHPPGAGHAEMAQDGPSRSVEQQVLGPPPEGRDRLINNPALQVEGHRPTEIRPVQCDPANHRPQDQGFQSTTHGFDLGKFRHGRVVPAGT